MISQKTDHSRMSGSSAMHVMLRTRLQGGCDGLVVRKDGIIFATGPGGVWILTPEGEHLGIIRTGQATSNCTLDAKNRYLYMTADMYLMRIRLR